MDYRRYESPSWFEYLRYNGPPYCHLKDLYISSLRWLACVMNATSCAICKGTSQCYKCQVIDLIKKNSQLSKELAYFKKQPNKALSLKKDYSSVFETDTKYLPIKYIGDKSEYRFLTLTFDPSKFGLYNLHQYEQNYIFYTIYRLIKKNQIKQLTGCFEYQQNGSTHAHLIIRSDLPDHEVETLLRPYYTDNERNKYAVKCLPAKFPNVEDYIMKESNEFYRYDPNIGYYEEGLVCEDHIETKLPDKQPKSEQVERLQKMIKAYKSQISDYQTLISTYEKRIKMLCL